MLISNHHAELNTDESSPVAVGVVWIPRQTKPSIRTRRDLRLPPSLHTEVPLQIPAVHRLRRPSRYTLGIIRRWWMGPAEATLTIPPRQPVGV